MLIFFFFSKNQLCFILFFSILLISAVSLIISCSPLTLGMFAFYSRSFRCAIKSLVWEFSKVYIQMLTAGNFLLSIVCVWICFAFIWILGSLSYLILDSVVLLRLTLWLSIWAVLETFSWCSRRGYNLFAIGFFLCPFESLHFLCEWMYG